MRQPLSEACAWRVGPKANITDLLGIIRWRQRATAAVGGRGRNEFIMGLGRLKGGIAAALGLWAVALALWAVRQYARRRAPVR